MVRSEEASLDAERLRRHLTHIVRRAIEGVSGASLVEKASAEMAPVSNPGGLWLVSVGKAAVPMATSWLEMTGDVVAGGVVATPVGDGADDRLELHRVGHPVPNEASVTAGRRALEFAAEVPPDGVLLVLLSGGASASMAVPVAPVTLADKIAATEALLRAGVPIDGINCVRKHLSAIKGGRLATATRGRVITLAISDVVGPVADDPAVIGSGPTAADPTTFADAREVVEHTVQREPFPSSARRVIDEGCRGERAETPKPGDPRLARSTIRVIGSRAEAMAAAAGAARDLGYAVRTIAAPVVGEARTAAAEHLGVVRREAAELPRPACVISSGETTVEVRGAGKGGRNQEFALACVTAYAEAPESMSLASVGTDGVDGPTDAAGAVVDGRTLARSRERGLDAPDVFLARNDSYTFFDGLGDLVRTGPSDTNVGDLQIVLFDHANR